MIYQKILEPEDNPPALCHYLFYLMGEYGIPKKILVYGETMKEILSVLQRDIGVPVQFDRLIHMKNFKDKFQKHLMDPGTNESMLKRLGLEEEEIAALLKMSGVDTEEELLQMLSERVTNFSDNFKDSKELQS